MEIYNFDVWWEVAKLRNKDKKEQMEILKPLFEECWNASKNGMKERLDNILSYYSSVGDWEDEPWDDVKDEIKEL